MHGLQLLDMRACQALQNGKVPEELRLTAREATKVKKLKAWAKEAKNYEPELPSFQFHSPAPVRCLPSCLPPRSRSRPCSTRPRWPEWRSSRVAHGLCHKV